MRLISKEILCRDSWQQCFFVLAVTWTFCILLMLCWGLWLEFHSVHITGVAELHIHSLRWTISLFVIWLLVLVLMWKGVRVVVERGRALKLVQDELEVSKKRCSRMESDFSTFFSSIPDPIVQIDIQECIVQVNPAFSELTGYSIDNVEGVLLSKLFVDSGPLDRSDDSVSRSFSERKCRLKKGRVIPTEVYGIEIRGEGGNVTGGFVLLRDISSRKASEKEKERLESRLMQSSKMEAIGTLAGGIAHDFNNVLGIISVNTDIALEEIPEENPARVNINRIIKAASRAKNLVKQILEYSRRKDQNLIPLMPGALVKESLHYLRSITPVSVTIVKNIHDDFKTVMMDPALMQVLLVNLFSRAVHDVQEKGTIEVTGRVVDFVENAAAGQTEIQPGQYFRLSVGHKGTAGGQEERGSSIGLVQKSRPRDENSVKSMETIMDIVKRHGGHIAVGSKPGSGTNIQIFFPVVEYEEDQHDDSETLTGTEHVLFVDDESMLLEMASMFLRRQGFKVTEEKNGLDALDAFRSNPDLYDIVIVDQTMPEMTGAELAAELLNIRPDIPIILFTGYSNKVSEDEVANIGIKEFLYKPFDGKTLVRNIRRVLDE